MINFPEHAKQSFLPKLGNPNRTYLALGDSYTIGQSVPLSENYPNQTITLLNKEGMEFLTPEIIATTGWTTTNLLDALKASKNTHGVYDIVTLLIGVNNQYQGRSLDAYRKEFQILLEKSIYYAGNKPSHVIVLSIPDYSVTPFAETRPENNLISNQIDAFNQINKEIAENYCVNYLDITTESRKALSDKTLLASDGLHYSTKEYTIWSAMLAPIIRKLVR